MATDTLSYCSVLSSQAGEALYASASRTEYYLILEYRGAWGEKAFEESQLPAEVKEHLNRLQKALPDCKLLLVRGQGRRKSSVGEGFHFFACHASEQRPVMVEFRLEDYADLVDLDIEAALAGDSSWATYQRQAPLFLVCTHGKRDLCCSRFGMPSFLKLAEVEGDNAWQSSHIGGHRFAANLFILPNGLLYGRLDPASTAEAVSAYRRGEVYLPAYRGRSCYPVAAQAAEYFLRLETGQLDLACLLLESIHPLDEHTTQVVFKNLHQERRSLLQLRITRAASKVFESCTLDKTTTPFNYSLETIEELEGN